MGKKTKVGKDRKDKFYKLAKETGNIYSLTNSVMNIIKFKYVTNLRIPLSCCIQVDPAKPSFWIPSTVTSMCRSLCCSRRLDASRETEHACFEYRHRNRFVCHQTNCWMY